MTLTLAPTFRFHDPANPLAYERLLRAAPRTGRCPVWLTPSACERADGWVAVSVPPFDPLAVLEEGWPGPGPFPGLAARRGPDREGVVGEAVAWAENEVWCSRLVVGAGRCPAELVASLGWDGAGRDLSGLVTVLRSWEMRFGAVVVELGADELVLAVAAPPQTSAEAVRVEAEHRALGVVRVPLCGARVWRLRWV
jgi:hypothetical protein